MKTIDSISECLHLDMLAWVKYPTSGSCCFVYPQFVNRDGTWEKIALTTFPNNGAFKGTIAGGSMTSFGLKEVFGSFVIARINAHYFDNDSYYEEDNPESTRYRALINPSFKEGKSDLEFKKFSADTISSQLVQVVEVAETVAQVKHSPNSVIHLMNQIDLYTKTIIIHCQDAEEDSYLGPFTYDLTNEYAARISTAEPNDYRAAKIKINKNSILTMHDDEGFGRISFADNILIQHAFNEANDEDIIDWMPNDMLMSILVQIINSSSYLEEQSSSDKRNYKKAIRNSSDIIDKYKIDSVRKQRMEKLVEQTENWASFPEILSTKILNNLNDDKLKKIVLSDSNIDSVKSRLSNLDEIAQQTEEELIGLKSKLEDRKHELSQIQIDINNAKESKNKALEEEKQAREKADQLRSEVLQQKQEELQELEEKIDKCKQDYQFESKLYNTKQQERRDLEQEIDNIIDDFKNDSKISSKVLESEMLRKVVASVNGVDLSTSETSEQTAITYVIRADESKISDIELIDDICTSITEHAGRHMSRNDVINMMLCLIQGYITTFSGLPGTGKTSLVNILAGALGLTAPDETNRFTEINVENGWTSYKDYIGYYNPLAKSYERTNADVYTAMKSLSHEANNAEDIPPYLFLLDEANLSPIEHYWAPFFSACDKAEMLGTPLALGGKENWTLPNQMRFMATVNFDHTTEALSNRFLDRSWVILLQPNLFDIEDQLLETNIVFNETKPFSMARLKKAFGKKQLSQAKSANTILLSTLLKICQDNSLPISPRSQLMMLHYINVAERLMDTSARDNAYDPLDFAFSQKVLPLINGANPNAKKLVEELQKQSGSLKSTSAHLKRIKEFGDDNGFYQFFA